MDIAIEFSAISGRGKVRQENQDRIYVNGNPFSEKDGIIKSLGADINSCPFYAVFDGMGGEQHGKKAAQTALDYFSAHCWNGTSAILLCREINREICRFMNENGISSMGATAAFINFCGRRAEICNIGDSRIYRISENVMQQLSVDHSMIMGRINQRRVLTQHLGIPESEMLIEPHILSTDALPEDIFIICSDGLTDMLTEDEIYKTIIDSETGDAAAKLYDEAMERGGRDNTSIIICKVKELYK